ncbi:hypothetical protein FGO68_gene13074 [Halteria grandinella]|uniref:Uncharacterized protein n=1 Tax=Halteria grandinella TaxID=5974 RepID=A0A8J8NWS5_HALGN|nr:hypothetical protein FGO68_gene13074 [Halteria grandinella]
MDQFNKTETPLSQSDNKRRYYAKMPKFSAEVLNFGNDTDVVIDFSDLGFSPKLHQDSSLENLDISSSSAWSSANGFQSIVGQLGMSNFESLQNSIIHRKPHQLRNTFQDEENHELIYKKDENWEHRLYKSANNQKQIFLTTELEKIIIKRNPEQHRGSEINLQSHSIEPLVAPNAAESKFRKRGPPGKSKFYNRSRKAQKNCGGRGGRYQNFQSQRFIRNSAQQQNIALGMNEEPEEFQLQFRNNYDSDSSKKSFDQTQFQNLVTMGLVKDSSYSEKGQKSFGELYFQKSTTNFDSQQMNGEHKIQIDRKIDIQCAKMLENMIKMDNLTDKQRITNYQQINDDLSKE